jgi:peroxiredoxin
MKFFHFNLFAMRSFLISVLILPVLCIAISCSDNTHSIEGNITGIGNRQVYLFSFEGSNFTLVDSVKSKEDIFVFSMNPEQKHGMYHVRWGREANSGVDVIYNYEDFKILCHKDSIELLRFENSPENDLFYAFYPIKLTIQQLLKLGDRMHRADPAGNKSKLIELNNYIDSLEYSVNQMIDELDSSSVKLFAYKVVRAMFYPHYSYESEMGRTKAENDFQFMQTYFFSYIDFNEPGLIRTPFIQMAIEDYLTLYVHPPGDEQFRKAADLIMSKAAVNDEMYDYVINLLVRSFETSDFWGVYLYLMETYLSEVCEGDGGYDDNHLLYEVVKNSRPGSPAPDIAGTTPDGRTVSLKGDVQGKAIVLLFWDPDCEHCKHIIDQLVVVWPAYKEKGLQILAFGLTTNRDEWLEAIDEHKMGDWIHMSDFKETESVVFEKLHVRGTPEIYILKEDYTIYSRPLNYMQMDKDISELLGI